MLDVSDDQTLALSPELVERAAGLSRKQRRVFEYLRAHPMAVASTTIEEVAKALSVSVSTIIRTAKELGYNGFGDLKRDLRAAYLQTLDPLEQARDRIAGAIDTDLVRAQMLRDRANLDELIDGTNPSDVADLARAIGEARRTLVVSLGSYAAVGHVLAHLGRFLGYQVSLESRSGSFLAHEVATVGPDDLLVVIGFWRDRRTLINVVKHARGKGVPVVVITDGPSSRLARIATRAYVVPTESQAFYQSMVAPMAFVYAVINALWQRDREYSERVASEATALYRDVDPPLTPDDIEWSR